MLLPEIFDGAETADDVFRIAAEKMPERYRETADKHPINSAEDSFRHYHGRRRIHRSTGGVTRYVPREQRRQFTHSEWVATKIAWKNGEREQDAYEQAAEELAQQGM